MLNIQQLRHLCAFGWLSYDLSPDLDERLTRLFELAGSFFDEELGRKQGLYPANHGTECGYYRIEGEKEYITLRRQVHADSALEDEASQAWREIARLLHGMLAELSSADGLDASVWDSLVDGSLTYPTHDTDLNHVITLLRIFRYYPTTGVADAHTDLGLLTLCVGDGSGLEVLDASLRPPQWRPAPCGTILVGETLRKLSNGIIKAGLHRVVGNPKGRSSIVFALRPNLNGQIDLSCFGRQEIVEARKFYMEIKAAKYNINAKQELRSAQRRARQGTQGSG